MKYPDRLSNPVDPALRWRCRNENHDGRCANTGTVGHSTAGHGGADGNEDPHAYCALHFPVYGDVKTLAIEPLGLGEAVAKLDDDHLAWARRIIASPDYHLSYGIEIAREALGLPPLEKREPGAEG